MAWLSALWSVVKSASAWIVRSAKYIYGIGKRVSRIIKKIIDLDQIIKEIKKLADDFLEGLRGRPPGLVKSKRFQQRKNLISHEVLGLIIFSKHVERFARHLEIHVSHLNTHFETLKNVVGLTEISLWQAEYINQIALKTNLITNKLNTFSGSDIEPLIIQDFKEQYFKMSIPEHYKSFEETRRLIHVECENFRNEVKINIINAGKLINAIDNLGGRRHQIYKWSKYYLLPVLESVEIDLRGLIKSIDKIPRLEISKKNIIGKS